MPWSSTGWKTLDDAKLNCAQDPSCAMFYDICGNERGFLRCSYDGTIVEEPRSLVCGPTVEKATILYSRGKLLILSVTVSLLEKTNTVLFTILKIFIVIFKQK